MSYFEFLTQSYADSVNHLIQNGQQLDAIRLACVLNLTDKYPPLSTMNEYVDKAKKTAQEILSMESDSLESLVCHISWIRLSLSCIRKAFTR
jgi:hypothetical protein